MGEFVIETHLLLLLRCLVAFQPPTKTTNEDCFYALLEANFESLSRASAVERSSSAIDLGNTFLNLDITHASLSALHWLFLNDESCLIAVALQYYIQRLL